MTYEIEFSQTAKRHTLAAYDWYESKRIGLGDEFEEELQSFFQTLFINPESYSYTKKPVRQGKINRFPFTVIYELRVNVIYILDVFDTRQDPSKKGST